MLIFFYNREKKKIWTVFYKIRSGSGFFLRVGSELIFHREKEHDHNIKLACTITILLNIARLKELQCWQASPRRTCLLGSWRARRCSPRFRPRPNPSPPPPSSPLTGPEQFGIVVLRESIREIKLFTLFINNIEKKIIRSFINTAVVYIFLNHFTYVRS